MVDVTASASAATASAPQGIPMSFGGIFDNLVIGLPLYFWIIFALAAVFIVFAVYVFYVYWNLGPVWGWWVASRKRTPMALKRNKNRRAVMVPMDSVAHIYHDEEHPEMWHQTSTESAQYIGDVPCVDVCDWHDWVDDPIMNQAICEMAEKWNENCKTTGQLQTESGESNLIFDYISFQKHLGNGDLKTFYTDGQVPIPAFFYVDLSKVERYLPKERSASTFGGFITYYSNKLVSDNSKNVWGLLLPIAAICGMVLITSIIAYLILKMASG
jgi:hypothetical protein